MSVPNSYHGRGTALAMSLDGANFTPIAQLTKIAPQGSKQSGVDQTNMTSPQGFTQWLATNVDAGEIAIEGILDPQDPSGRYLGLYHGQLTLLWFLATLKDGTEYLFQAYVSEYMPFAAEIRKPYTFSAKLRVTGGIYSPLTAFDPQAFDPVAYQVVQV